MRLYCLIIFVIGLGSVTTHAAQRQSSAHWQHQTKVIAVDGHNLQYTEWFSGAPKTKLPTLLLLSGPNDNWNSDSTWFARLAPKLSASFRVIALDRAAIGLAQPEVPLGYAHFATDLNLFMQKLNLNEVNVIAFASANISLLHYFNQATRNPTKINSLILIDPDVITDFSIKRYAKDAYPFKKNQQSYAEYIKQGKYLARAKQKNQIEQTHLQQLALNDPMVDWEFIKNEFNKRLISQNLVNLFGEIAIYDQDLKSTQGLKFPSTLKLVVFDTDFESHYISQSENPEMQQGLIEWRKDAKKYYQRLVAQQTHAEYIEVAEKEHLLMFSQPNRFIDLLDQLRLKAN
ncbi:alpha/beta fold hydrolase [Aliikangiella sp. IMCC44653]